MKNELTALVHGRGCVDLRFSYGKIVSLFSVLHVPNVRKNMVSISVLNNLGYKQVIESDKFVLSKHGLSDEFWGEAMLTTFYLLNKVPNKRNKTTPYELWTKRKPNMNYLKVWGCRAVKRLPDPKLKTFGDRGIDCIFIGYDEHSMAFKFYVIKPNEFVLINFIIESRDAIFYENRFSCIPSPSQRSLINETDDIGDSEVPEQVVVRLQIDLQRNMKVYGTIEKFKARLVIQGFRQELGIDYIDTYAPVARISTIRLLIDLASIHNLIIHQMDVNTYFLNGELEEEAPKQWHQKFDEVVLSNSYLLNQSDKCMYNKFDEYGKEVIICLYVDDMLIFRTDQVQVDLTKEYLSLRFSMKDMGEVDVILDIRIKHESNEISISQSRYIKKLEYSRVIGGLMFFLICTRLDIAFTVGKLSRYTSNPSTQHWQAVQRVLKYLKKTMDYSLSYNGYPSVVEGYTNARWIRNTKDNSSTSGWVFLCGGSDISWASKKQTCITSSTIESEFLA
ncbi:zinc finger, CCHC-type containing protein [Tanacetum coccineum]